MLRSDQIISVVRDGCDSIAGGVVDTCGRKEGLSREDCENAGCCYGNDGLCTKPLTPIRTDISYNPELSTFSNAEASCTRKGM